MRILKLTTVMLFLLAPGLTLAQVGGATFEQAAPQMAAAQPTAVCAVPEPSEIKTVEEVINVRATANNGQDYFCAPEGREIPAVANPYNEGGVKGYAAALCRFLGKGCCFVDVTWNKKKAVIICHGMGTPAEYSTKEPATIRCKCPKAPPPSTAPATPTPAAGPANF